jgi:hypothetical protein
VILPNPLLELFPEVKKPSHERPQDEAESRTWESLGSVVAFLDILLRFGELHRERVTTTARRIPHNLHRRPRLWLPTMPPDDSAFVYAPGGVEAWDADTITLQASAAPAKGYLVVEFLLI